jgi:ribosome-associated protein
LPNDVALRLERLASHLMTQDGVLIIHAQRFRTQDMNRSDARARLVDMIRQAAVVPKKRRPTKPGKAAVERRLDGKMRRASVKQQRRARPDTD